MSRNSGLLFTCTLLYSFKPFMFYVNSYYKCVLHTFQRPKDRFSLGPNPQTPGMPHNTRYMPPKSRQKSLQEFTEPLVISRNANHASLPPLARIHRKDNPRAWKEAFGDRTNGMESIDIESLKKRLPENRWKKLLEELYRDKKYFDYVKSKYNAIYIAKKSKFGCRK